VLVLGGALVGCGHPTKLTDSEVAASIKQTLESNLFQLPPRVQGHYGIRLFRITGDNKYLYAALYDYLIVADRLHAIEPHLNDQAYIKNAAEKFTARLNSGTREKLRREALKKYPEHIFYANKLLKYSARLDEFGASLPESAFKALQAYDFLPGLTDEKMIRAWAAQLANHVYWLRQLGIADHTKAFKQAFLEAYPHSEDHALSRWHFRNKLYGLTHFVLAASGYYQRHVDTNEFGWILDYFAQNQQKILTHATDNIAAEIAICFLLMRQSDHPLVSLTKARMIASYDPVAQMIPSVSGRIDLATGEHRNVLAYMLLAWPEKLHPGPYFDQFANIQKYLPRHHFDSPPQEQEDNH
jgi:hypothetical protein